MVWIFPNECFFWRASDQFFSAIILKLILLRDGPSNFFFLSRKHDYFGTKEQGEAMKLEREHGADKLYLEARSTKI